MLRYIFFFPSGKSARAFKNLSLSSICGLSALHFQSAVLLGVYQCGLWAASVKKGDLKVHQFILIVKKFSVKEGNTSSDNQVYSFIGSKYGHF